jgi:hypothetical protein
MQIFKQFPLSIFLFFLLFSCNQTSSKDTQRNILAGVILHTQAEEALRLETLANQQCETSIDNSKTFDITTPLELCTPKAGKGRHFRFEAVGTTTNNGYLNLLVGYGLRTDASNFPTTAGFGGGSASATTTSGDGRWRIFFGKSQSCDKALLDFRFSGTNTGITSYGEFITTSAISTPTVSGTGCIAQNSGVWGPSTVCMDITKGKQGISPRVTVWVTGKNGADCANTSTLKSSNFVFEKKDWTSLVETKDDRNYIYRNLDGISVSKVVIRTETALKD